MKRRNRVRSGAILHARVTAEQKAALDRAAAKAGTTVTEIVLRALVPVFGAARDTKRRKPTRRLSTSQFGRLVLAQALHRLCNVMEAGLGECVNDIRSDSATEIFSVLTSIARQVGLQVYVSSADRPSVATFARPKGTFGSRQESARKVGGASEAANGIHEVNAEG